MAQHNSFIVDQLESRRMFANVSAQLAGGLLQIGGTASNDAITVSVSGDNLLVKAGSGTTVNGGSAAVSFAKFSVTSIFAEMGAGRDSLKLDGVDQGLGGTLNTGSGDDAVTLWHSKLTGMLLEGGAGNDVVSVLKTTLQNVTINTGSGNDLVSCLANTVFNASTVNLGDGSDVFVAVKNTVFGFTSVDGGGGFDVAIGLFNTFGGGSFLSGVEWRLGI